MASTEPLASPVLLSLRMPQMNLRIEKPFDAQHLRSIVNHRVR